MAWKAIKVKPPKSVKVLNASIKKNIGKTVKGPKKDWETFVAPFRAKNRPTIILKTESKLGEISAFTGVESNWSKGKKATKQDKLMFVTRGTSVRYATMSSNFSPKTSSRNIHSSGARGDRDPVRYGIPEPGIEAREIEETIAQKRKIEVQRELYFVLRDALKEANAT